MTEKKKTYASDTLIQSLCGEFRKHNQIGLSDYEKADVKRGLRNLNGTGVMAGVTRIGNVQGYVLQDGEKMPREGRLIYRGINVEDMVNGFVAENRFGFEETAYLLVFGALPNRAQLEEFNAIMEAYRDLPPGFSEDMIIKAPSRDVMNKLARSVLALYSYDDRADDNSVENQLRQALQLIARCPVIIAHAYSTKRCYYDNEDLYLHRSKPGLSVAGNFLNSVRQNKQYTAEEARLLDLCLVLHAEHGGGNNSAFACRVLSSTGTDIYSSIAAAVGSLKGPRHGGANKKVMEMFRYIERDVKDWQDDEELRAYLEKITRREAGDGSGLIYGIGHAIYTLSDPRAAILKRFARSLAKQKGMENEFQLFEGVERVAPEVLLAARGGRDQSICANVDLYSGFVYKMLNIPEELYTPLFAMARMAGWCAHRIEEVCTPYNKIIRPAYKAVAPMEAFTPLSQRL
ncbi:MAG TPA: citrate synthase [Oscillospiraceae bacterium]|nr:citrate synthase [Oscillospiraceae bacterium]